MNRRHYLALAGVATAGTLAGCLSESDDDDGSTELTPDPTGGDDGNADEDGDDGGDDAYELYAVGGQEVPLAPVDDVYAWYEDDAAAFLDARSAGQYEAAHIAGAAHSPAPDGLASDDPTEDLSTTDRIVTYCGCPHHLSGQRAASLLAEGFEQVYAIDEGFQGWLRRDYPVEEGDSPNSLSVYEVRGSVDAAHAGAYARLEAPATDQREFGAIGEDGRFEIVARFADVDEDTEALLETPAGSRRGTLGELTDGEIAF